MKRTISILTVLAVMAVGVPAFASNCCAKDAKAPAKKPAAKPAEIKCPVMGGKIKNTKTALKSTYKGQTYYFCCAGCKPQFDKNPDKYIKKATAPAKKAASPKK